MTCEDLLEWAERQIDFDSYDTIEELQTDLLNLPGKASTVDARTKNAEDKLKDWFDGNLDVDGFNSDSIKTNILNRQIDTATTGEELDAIDITPVSSTSVRSALQSSIDKKRTELSDELQSVRDQIESAISQDDLADITIGPIQREFGKEAADKIRTLLADKGSKLRSAEEEFQESLQSSIDAATTLSQLDSLEGRASDAPTTRLESQLLSRIESRRSELEEI